MLHAQPFGNRAIKVRIGEPQFISKGFRLRVQVGEMIAPTLNFTPRGCNGFGFNLRAACCGTGSAV